MKMRVTKRDLKLMDWINRAGFVTIHQIAKWLGVAVSTAYLRIKKLVCHGYLIHERIFHGAPGVYRVSLKGVYISGNALPPLRQIRLSTYHHDLIVIDLSLILIARYGGSFVYERELRHQEGQYQLGQKGHISDGLLTLEEKQIAIEVELTTKGSRRLAGIVSHYLKSFQYAEVWYFCGSEAIERRLKSLPGAAFIKTYSLESVLK